MYGRKSKFEQVSKKMKLTVVAIDSNSGAFSLLRNVDGDPVVWFDERGDNYIGNDRVTSKVYGISREVALLQLAEVVGSFNLEIQCRVAQPSNIVRRCPGWLHNDVESCFIHWVVLEVLVLIPIFTLMVELHDLWSCTKVLVVSFESELDQFAGDPRLVNDQTHRGVVTFAKVAHIPL